MIRQNAKFMFTPWFVEPDGSFHRYKIDLCGERCGRQTLTDSDLKSYELDPTICLRSIAFRQATRFPTLSQRLVK